MSEKIVGYILLALGVLIIAVAGINVYRVITKEAQPIQFLSVDLVKPSTSKQTEVKSPEELLTNPQNIPLLEMMGLSPEILITTTNFLIHIFLMGFMANIGFKIATLGTQMVRPIVVDLKTQVSRPQKDSEKK